MRRAEYLRQYGEETSNIRYGQDVSLTKPGPGAKYSVAFEGRSFDSGKRWWGTTKEQLQRALKTDRIIVIGNSLRHFRYLDESSLTAIGNLWDGFLGQADPIYVVQTNTDLVQRCLLMTTDPGDLVLDPTCGSGTTAYVAEQWGRRWITIDTSRVALALARARMMGARYPWYLLTDSREGQLKEGEVTRTLPSDTPTYGRLRHGFVYKRVPHITLKSIANNAEIDTIWANAQPVVEEALARLNEALDGFGISHPIDSGVRSGQSLDFSSFDETTLAGGQVAKSNEFLEWEVPRFAHSAIPKSILPEWEQAWRLLEEIENFQSDETKPDWQNKQISEALRIDLNDSMLNLNESLYGEGKHYLTRENLPQEAVAPWPPKAKKALEDFWKARIARQKEIDASIAARADTEYLYDQPYEDKGRVRVAGPFTVPSARAARMDAR